MQKGGGNKHSDSGDISGCKIAFMMQSGFLTVAGAAAENYVHGRSIDTIGASWLLHSRWQWQRH